MGPREKCLEVLGQPAMHVQALFSTKKENKLKLILNASPTKLLNMLLPINKHRVSYRGGRGAPPQRKYPPPPPPPPPEF